MNLDGSKKVVSINACIPDVIISEDAPLLEEEEKDEEEQDGFIVRPQTREADFLVRPCKRRWYILASFSLLAGLQACVWNTWAPISQSAFQVFPAWSNTTIATLSNWGNITYILFLIPMCWLMDRYGLRCSVVVTGLLQLVGAGLRCITTDLVPATVLIHCGQFANGVAGIIICSAPPLLSATWFPPKERTTATAISTASNSFGIAASFLLGPWIVPEVHHHHVHNRSQSDVSMLTSSQSPDPDDVKKITEQIMLLMYIEFAATAFTVLCIFLYFPSKPPVPPSLSASVQRYSFKDSVVRLVRNSQVWMLALPFSLAMAVYSTWVSVMDLTLDKLHVNQVEAGWIGFYAVVAGSVGSIICARFTDIISGSMKLTILISLTVYSGLTVCFALLYTKVIPFEVVYVYAVVIMMSLTTSSLYPLFFELAVEITYPVDEGLVGGFFSGLWNLVGMFFLLVFFIPDIGTLWMNWCMIGTAVVSLPFVVFLKERYIRSDLDNHRHLVCQ